MTLLLSDVRTQFGILKHDISDVDTDDFIQWCKSVENYCYRMLKDSDPERFILTQSYSVTTSPSTSALVSGFRDLIPLGCGIFDANGLTLPITRYGSTLRGYYITGTNIVFTGIENETFTMRYIPKLTQLSAITDYFTVDSTVTGVVIIEEEYLDYVLQALDVKYSQWDDDTGSEANADQRFIRVLDDMLSNFNRNPQVYCLDDTSNAF